MTIYIINQIGSNFWKIGYTAKSAESRLRNLKTGSPRALIVYTQFPGEAYDEKILHNLLFSYHTDGGDEWFEAERAIIDNAINEWRNGNEKVFKQREKWLATKPTNLLICANCGIAKKHGAFTVVARLQDAPWCMECINSWNFHNQCIWGEGCNEVGKLESYWMAWKNDEKMCFGCMKIKHIGQYRKCNGSHDKLTMYCNACKVANGAEWRRKNAI
jgi:hypothetical protein